jgi:hypothetical protein
MYRGKYYVKLNLRKWNQQEPGENCTLMSFIICILPNITERREDEIHEACSKHDKDKKFVQNFDWQT